MEPASRTGGTGGEIAEADLTVAKFDSRQIPEPGHRAGEEFGQRRAEHGGVPSDTLGVGSLPWEGSRLCHVLPFLVPRWGTLKIAFIEPIVHRRLSHDGFMVAPVGRGA